jgi:anti-sigma regulatory factor (Ser/Thr protein kinase)
VRYEAQFPAVRTSAHEARRFVSDAITGAPRDVCDSVALIASELATNSVRHAASAFEIRIERFPDRIRIEVEDDGRGVPVVKSPGPQDTSGRGLQIVTALADEWGIIPKSEPPGKTVWVTIALPSDDDPALHARQSEMDTSEGNSRRPTGPRRSSTTMGAVRDGLLVEGGASSELGPMTTEFRLCTGTGIVGRRRRTMCAHRLSCPT